MSKPAQTIDININSTIYIYEAIKKVRKYKISNYDPIIVVACFSDKYGETLNCLEGCVSKLKNDIGWKQDILMEQIIFDMLDYWRNIGG